MPLEFGSAALVTISLPKKAARTIYVPAFFVENFFIMVQSMLSGSSRTSDVDLSISELFWPRNKFSVPVRSCWRLQIPRPDTENVYHEVTRFGAGATSIAMKFVL